MAVRMRKKGKPVRKEELDTLQRALGGALPTDYLSFMVENNGGIPETNIFDIPETGGNAGVNEFFSVEKVLKEKRILHGRLPASAWPIADADGGNLVCLAGGANPGVYFWDHELETDEGEEPTWANMFPLAPTFAEFWENLREFDINSVELKPGQVKSVWVDPNFKPEF